MSLREGRSPTRQPLDATTLFERLLRYARNDVAFLTKLLRCARNDFGSYSNSRRTQESHGEIRGTGPHGAHQLPDALGRIEDRNLRLWLRPLRHDSTLLADVICRRHGWIPALVQPAPRIPALTPEYILTTYTNLQYVVLLRHQYV